MKILLGKSEIKLKELEDNSVDSIVTDPPYGLKFMSKKWDYDVPTVELWKECLRVLKPGGYLLSFSGARTYHRMVVNIEDAGFEIRDQIMWVYGSGFPKNYNIGKAIDKQLGNKREIIGEKIRGDVQTVKTKGAGYLTDPANRNNIKHFGYDAEILTKGNSEWEGWGTSLKPAHEPIVMARKPLSENTIVKNVIKHGTGGINIDASRVPLNLDIDNSQLRTINRSQRDTDINNQTWGMTKNKSERVDVIKPNGRWPANFIHDGSEEVTDLFPDTKSGKVASDKSSYKSDTNTNFLNGFANQNNQHGYSGNASRFFYCAKASKKDRDEGLDDFEYKESAKRDNGQLYGMNTNKFRPDGSERNSVLPKKNNHPTLKPTKLMKYLVRMVTPPNGIVLDPFMGSGSTGKACKQLGYDFIGIDDNADYFKIAKARIETALQVLDKESATPAQNKKSNKFFDL